MDVPSTDALDKEGALTDVSKAEELTQTCSKKQVSDQDREPLKLNESEECGSVPYLVHQNHCGFAGVQEYGEGVSCWCILISMPEGNALTTELLNPAETCHNSEESYISDDEWLNTESPGVLSSESTIRGLDTAIGSAGYLKGEIDNIQAILARLDGHASRQHSQGGSGIEEAINFTPLPDKDLESQLSTEMDACTSPTQKIPQEESDDLYSAWLEECTLYSHLINRARSIQGSFQTFRDLLSQTSYCRRMQRGMVGSVLCMVGRARRHISLRSRTKGGQ